MKKRIPGFILLFVVAAVAGIYIFIPAKLKVSNSVIISATLNSTGRIIIDSSKWKSWWPDTSIADAGNLTYNDLRYSPSKGVFNAVDVNIHNDERQFDSRITVLP